MSNAYARELIALQCIRDKYGLNDEQYKRMVSDLDHQLTALTKDCNLFELMISQARRDRYINECIEEGKKRRADESR